jgi:hypothetical protein
VTQTQRRIAAREQRGYVGSMVRRGRIGFTTGSGELYRPLRAEPLKLRNVAVEFAFPRNVLFLLWRHFRGILTTRYTARSELSASDLVLREPFLLGIIARHRTT